MIKVILVTLFSLLAGQLFAQTEGISYQAVIIGPDNQELPGQDAKGNILPNTAIAIQFSILNADNSVAYQEVQKTNTDQYGRINLLIGEADPDKFELIDWDGTPKDLKVEIDFKGGSNFVDMSRETLTFLPYAYHRNITARGTLIVNGTSDLNGELKVQGPTNLNSTLNVNDKNATNLSGDLTVDGKTLLNGGLTARGVSVLDTLILLGDMNVKGASLFEGPASFLSPTEFSDLIVHGTTGMEGQVTINSNLDSIGDDSNYDAYPLLIQGSKQGIAIKVNGNRGMANNYVSFWDANTNKMWGRIEGISETELENSDEYIQGRKSKNWAIAVESYNTAKAGWEVGLAVGEVVAASTSSTVCAGLGACVTAPVPSLIVVKSVALALKTADLILTGINLGKAISERADYDNFMKKNIGVTYSSGSGDYAEWLPKKNIGDNFSEGELVGIKNGFVTKDVWGADKIMIVSTRPIVLGNMPPTGNEKDNVKIAFMGQVPAKVSGPVTPGDYILPDNLGGGFSKAVHPGDMKTSDYKKIAGVAWNVIERITNDLNVVNVAVGINTNDLAGIIDQQQQAIETLHTDYNLLKSKMEKSNAVLTNLVPGYADAIGTSENNAVALKAKEEPKVTIQQQHNETILYPSDEDIIYFEVTRQQIDSALKIAKREYIQYYNNATLNAGKPANAKNARLSAATPDNLVPVENHPFWNRIESNPAYREEVIQSMQEKLKKAFHTHKRYEKAFSGMKVAR